MSYSDTVREHARIAILRFLEGAPTYTSNVSILATQLPLIGIAFTRAQGIARHPDIQRPKPGA